jgi:hypothetical protein
LAYAPPPNIPEFPAAPAKLVTSSFRSLQDLDLQPTANIRQFLKDLDVSISKLDENGKISLYPAQYHLFHPGDEDIKLADRGTSSFSVLHIAGLACYWLFSDDDLMSAIADSLLPRLQKLVQKGRTSLTYHDDMIVGLLGQNIVVRGPNEYSGILTGVIVSPSDYRELQLYLGRNPRLMMIVHMESLVDGTVRVQRTESDNFEEDLDIVVISELDLE